MRAMRHRSAVLGRDCQAQAAEVPLCMPTPMHAKKASPTLLEAG